MSAPVMLALTINDAGEVSGKYTEGSMECNLHGTSQGEVVEGEWRHPLGNAGTFRFTLRPGASTMSGEVSCPSWSRCLIGSNVLGGKGSDWRCLWVDDTNDLKGWKKLKQGAVSAVDQTANSQPPPHQNGVEHSKVPAAAPVTTRDFIPLQELMAMKESLALGSIDATRLEEYLSDEDFRSLFNMARDDFHKLKKWKQSSLKKQHNLF